MIVFQKRKEKKNLYTTLSLGALPIALPSICRAPFRFNCRISNCAANSHIFANENFP